jgi:hypothetical protein
VCESERGIEQKHHATFYMFDGIFITLSLHHIESLDTCM